ncbi:putative Pectin lyase-like superfamily protein [Melia azedarach]|uniref:Pectin lyase-like superfamily protein n=1 Tax=Melia azedarach TaxID=155640 RepID=A0ACC1YD14_MELAZ|nr:putative Pectin lyase-like superfamily protein [Melia azedarach]
MGLSFYFQKVFSMLVIFTFARSIHAADRVFNVKDFGARADGIADDSKAFESAWREACNWNGNSKVLVPLGKYLVKFVVFQGPCKAPLSFQLDGFVQAPPGLSKLENKESWITFQYLRNFTLTGKGTFHGQGQTAWPENQCHKNSDCKLPISIRFSFLNDSTISGIQSIDSKYFHMNILGCYNLNLDNIKISAHKDSPNTDGIHIGRSSGVVISHSVIATGDDCVSLGDGSQNILVSNVMCGPGHGISIGSLGKYKNEEDVVGLTVRNCTFTDTSNGVRIKTWPDSQPGIASNFTFEDLVMNNVENPIVIDQQYCPHSSCNIKVPSRVKISNVSFRNIRGTSSTKVAISLVCSQETPCKNVEIGDINLLYNGLQDKGLATSSCSNVKPILLGKQIPATCA